MSAEADLVGAEDGIDPLEAGADLSDPTLFHDDRHLAYFRFLRRHRPLAWQPPRGRVPGFWSVTRYADVVDVESRHQVFSSEGSIVLEAPEASFPIRMFIAMDPPRHTQCRAALLPLFNTGNLRALEHTVRERVHEIMDGLPVGEPFDWVARVARELTARMLATLLGCPQADRDRLMRWSDLATSWNFAADEHDPAMSTEMMECLRYFTALARTDAGAAESGGMVSSLVGCTHGQAMPPSELLGNVLLLIVAGNDTSRNSISGSILAMDAQPAQRERLREEPALVGNLVSEVIRWQAPLAYMRRTARVDSLVGTQRVRAGDRVLLWYLSANRDESVFADGERFDITRANARQHLSFGSGIHRCLGARLAEIMLAAVWEELLARRWRVRPLREPVRVASSFVRGYAELPVRIERD